MFHNFLCFGSCFLADKSLKLFLIGWWFAIDCENSHFGGLFGEVSGGEFTEFVGNFVLLLLFAVLLPGGDEDGFEYVL